MPPQDPQRTLVLALRRQVQAPVCQLDVDYPGHGIRAKFTCRTCKHTWEDDVAPPDPTGAPVTEHNAQRLVRWWTRANRPGTLAGKCAWCHKAKRDQLYPLIKAGHGK